jgi:putative integral membrane protein (TIGR02587 family)
MRTAAERESDRRFFVGLARAFAGAVLFSLPLLMTMEMWWLGFSLDGGKLVVFMLVMVPVLVALDYFSGFDETSGWREAVGDGMVAYGVGVVASFVILFLFGIVDVGQPVREVVGKVAIQSVPASFGAVLANSQLAGGRGSAFERRRQRAGYGAQLFIMTAGAGFLAFNVAPTEEMILIAFFMTPWHRLLLVVASLLMMHAFVFASVFRGAAPRHRTSGWGLFLRYTVVGYVVALIVSAYVLWTFGRMEDSEYASYLMMTIVLGFPAALGAAAARLII